MRSSYKALTVLCKSKKLALKSGKLAVFGQIGI